MRPTLHTLAHCLTTPKPHCIPPPHPNPQPPHTHTHTRFHFSSGNSSTGATYWMPALVQGGGGGAE